MPHLHVVDAGGSSQRRLISEALDRHGREGYACEGRFEHGDRPWGELFASFGGASLFEKKSVLVLEKASALGPFPPELEPSLEPPGSPTVFLAVYDGDGRKFLSSEALARCTVDRVEAPPRWGAARKRWIEALAAEEGARLSAEAGALLGEWYEDPEELRQEIAKLARASRGNEVGGALVRSLCVDEGHGLVLSLLDGVCRKNRSEVMKTLGLLRRSEELLPVGTALYNRLHIAFLATCFTGADLEKIYAAQGVRDYARRLAAEAGRHYPPRAIQRAVAELIALLCAEKWGKGAGWVGMDMVLLRLLDAGRG